MTIHRVDCDAGEKIQEKIAVARPGDTILVSGRCHENVTVPSEAVRIIREIMAWYDAEPSRQVVDPDFNALLDKIINAYETAWPG